MGLGQITLLNTHDKAPRWRRFLIVGFRPTRELFMVYLNLSFSYWAQKLLHLDLFFIVALSARQLGAILLKKSEIIRSATSNLITSVYQFKDPRIIKFCHTSMINAFFTDFSTICDFLSTMQVFGCKNSQTICFLNSNWTNTIFWPWINDHLNPLLTYIFNSQTLLIIDTCGMLRVNRSVRLFVIFLLTI